VDQVIVNIRGEEVDVSGELRIGGDLGKEMSRLPGQVAYYGGALAEAQALEAQVTAQYRAWRAKQIEAVLESEPKLAEWKVKAKLEALPQFMQHKEAIARTEKVVRDLWAVYEAFLRKADMLRSKGARQRAELEASGGISTSLDPDEKATRAGKVVKRHRARPKK